MLHFVGSAALLTALVSSEIVLSWRLALSLLVPRHGRWSQRFTIRVLGLRMQSVGDCLLHGLLILRRALFEWDQVSVFICLDAGRSTCLDGHFGFVCHIVASLLPVCNARRELGCRC